MEKLTIARIGAEKVINYTNKKTGKPDSFKKIGVLTNEHGDRWFDITFRGEVPVKVGQSYDFEVKEREYNGKTYYDAELPRETKGGGMSSDQFTLLMRELRAINTNVLRVWAEVDPAKDLTSAGTRVPDFIPRTPEETKAFNATGAQPEPPAEAFTDDDFPQF